MTSRHSAWSTPTGLVYPPANGATTLMSALSNLCSMRSLAALPLVSTGPDPHDDRVVELAVDRHALLTPPGAGRREPGC